MQHKHYFVNVFIKWNCVKTFFLGGTKRSIFYSSSLLFLCVPLVINDQKTLRFRHISYWKCNQNWQISIKHFFFSEIIYFMKFCWNVPVSSSCQFLLICHFSLSPFRFTSSLSTLLSLWSTRWDPSKLFHLSYEISSLGMKN